MPKFTTRLQHAWNAFNGRDHPSYDYLDGLTYTNPMYESDSYIPGNERSIVRTIRNRFAMDAASVAIKHVKIDDDGRFAENVKDNLNEALTVSTNLDQAPRAFLQDAYYRMLECGHVAICPTVTDNEPTIDGGNFDIHELRVGKVVKWSYEHVEVEMYNTYLGRYWTRLYNKRDVVIVQNPFYMVMNTPNSYFQRLERTLITLDKMNEQAASGKLNMIIQVPYPTKSEIQKTRAKSRRDDLESQLRSSPMGVAYIDTSEKIIQLNRPIENTLLDQVKYLTDEVLSQLGITLEILNGTANEVTMLNYMNRIIEPMVAGVVEEMRRKFLTKTARSYNHSIMYFRDFFQLAPLKDKGETIEKLKASEVVSANEARAMIGLVPATDERADQLINSNINPIDPNAAPAGEDVGMSDIEQDNLANEFREQLNALEDIDTQLDEIGSDAGIVEEPSEGEESLAHYASPYYDPVKAHEYYEEHKQLKGRSSPGSSSQAEYKAQGKVFNQSGKEAVDYVKKNISEEQKRSIEEAQNAAKQEVERHKRDMAMKVNQLKILAETASGPGKDLAKKAVQSRIQRLREENEDARKNLNSSIKSTLEKLQNDYKVKLNDELEAIYADASFYDVKKTSTKKKSSKKKSSSSS